MTPLRPVLAAVAEAIARTLGYRAVVVNLRRAAWDDFEVVVVLGNEESRELLMGKTSSIESWAGLLDERFRRHGAYLVPGDDALVVPLHAASGELLGIVSVDEPVSGRRPTDAELQTLAGVAAHAALAVEHAQAAGEGRRHRAAMEHLLHISAQLTRHESADDILEAVCAGIHEALGFDKVVVYFAEPGAGRLVAQASLSFPPEVVRGLEPLTLEVFAELLDPAFDRHGCLLMSREEAVARTPEVLHGVYSSVANGRGPLAWDHHWLIVPLYDSAGAIEGIVWVDDPQDRLLPTDERLQALRAFSNQASSAIESARQLERMRHLAEHDPLTGLRNRRGFEQRLEAMVAERGDGDVSLLICDIDHFKRINDSLGHEAGDAALRRFADVLRGCADEVPIRLGGEEFALVLPATGEADALALAESLRRTVRREFAGFPAAVTVSVGVAAMGREAPDATALVRAANRALYAAKRLGRDRAVLHHAETLEMMDALHDPEQATGEQLAAAMLLAETLDLRDVGTARHSQTVGRYSEQIARELGFSPARVERMRAAGILHDIGKLGVADAILHKPGKLEPHEWEEMKRHSEIGARILEHAHLRDIGAWVLAHHERIDGRGYPYGLEGDAIPVEARILAVADAYEAMTAERPYKRALPEAAARDELRRGAGSQFDADIVAVFLRVLEHDQVGFHATLPAAADANAMNSRRPNADHGSSRPSSSASAATGLNPSATASGSSR